METAIATSSADQPVSPVAIHEAPHTADHAADHASDHAALPSHAARPMGSIETHAAWGTLARIPETLTALIPIRRLTVLDLLSLEPGKILTSEVAIADDIPIKIGLVQLAWSEFEVVERTLAVRLTRLT